MDTEFFRTQSLAPLAEIRYGIANTRAVPLVRKVNAHQGRVFFFEEQSDIFITTIPLVEAQAMRSDTGEVTPQVTPQVTHILELAITEKSLSELQAAAALKDRVHFLKTYLEPFLLAGWLERTIPDKPRSSKQKYRLTAKGRAVLNSQQSRNN